MQSNFVSPEYMELQQNIIVLQKKWQAEIPVEKYNEALETLALDNQIPLVLQTSLHFDSGQSLNWIKELSNLLTQFDPQLEAPLNKIVTLLDQDLSEKWLEEILAMNPYCFKQFAEENQLPEWLPHFLAEHVLRPYLRVLSQACMNTLPTESFAAGTKQECPICGEPVRLGQITGHGEKVMHCPRCEYHWAEKRLICSHCGNEDFKTMHYLTVEDDKTAQVHVCEKCKGYVKIIDTRNFLTKPASPLLDLQTIHLDFVAQQNGYV